ncbi:5251_t:CDS:2 [Acaulospora morrowiae]|uniref:5251_t:CDS:1 n=1 Tax=Acaulospora morrowiae TaxID=94023 RepID=A0A9N9F8L3_9GLOM|nr:5251_t:CDS:2 [Acaulospora morrowiae]
MNKAEGREEVAFFNNMKLWRAGAEHAGLTVERFLRDSQRWDSRVMQNLRNLHFTHLSPYDHVTLPIGKGFAWFHWLGASHKSQPFRNSLVHPAKTFVPTTQRCPHRQSNDASQSLRKELIAFTNGQLSQANKGITQTSVGLLNVEKNIESARDNIKETERNLKSIGTKVFKLDPSFIPVVNIPTKDKWIEAKYVG